MSYQELAIKKRCFNFAQTFLKMCSELKYFPIFASEMTYHLAAIRELQLLPPFTRASSNILTIKYSQHWAEITLRQQPSDSTQYFGLRETVGFLRYAPVHFQLFIRFIYTSIHPFINPKYGKIFRNRLVFFFPHDFVLFLSITKKSCVLLHFFLILYHVFTFYSSLMRLQNVD